MERANRTPADSESGRAAAERAAPSPSKAAGPGPDTAIQDAADDAIAASPRVAAQRQRIAAIARSPRAVAQRQRLRASFGPAAHARSGPPVVQRTIWRFKKRGWRVAEVGTTGNNAKPNAPKDGLYFNDVNNKSGDKIADVRAGLLDRALQTGSVTDLGHDGEWQALSARLMALCDTTYKKRVADGAGLLTIGIVRLTHTAGKTTGAATLQSDEPIEIEAVKTFILKFMRKNGQLDYIERQPWFKDASSEVDINLNFYYDRPMSSSGELGMHKDTAGDNLFVNIIFNNAETTPATEWTQDRAAPLGAKAKLLKKLMPSKMVKDINTAKLALAGDQVKIGGKDTIEGGTLPPLGYVSWVDELIWHSTPTLANRPRYSAMAPYIKTELLNDNHHVYEAALLLIEKPGTWLYRRWHSADRAGTVFDRKTWQRYQGVLNTNAKAKASVIKDVEAFDWAAHKWSGRGAEELDKDFRNLSEKSSVPTGITGRARANSDPTTLAGVQKAAKDQPKRSFLRTWIRVAKKKT